MNCLLKMDQKIDLINNLELYKQSLIKNDKFPPNLQELKELKDLHKPLFSRFAFIVDTPFRKIVNGQNKLKKYYQKYKTNEIFYNQKHSVYAKKCREYLMSERHKLHTSYESYMTIDSFNTFQCILFAHLLRLKLTDESESDPDDIIDYPDCGFTIDSLTPPSTKSCVIS